MNDTWIYMYNKEQGLLEMRKNRREVQVRYYQSFADDFIESRNQSFQLTKGYSWIHESVLYHFFSRFVYLLGEVFAFPYCRLVLQVKIKNRSVLRQYRNTGFFLYGNHTQSIGDAFIPIRMVAPKRGYAVVSPANLGIPVLGAFLPALGALPLPKSFREMKKFDEAIRQRILEGSCVVLYPEAHVWPWYTGIRPFSASSFGFPVECSAPSFCMTTTYQKRKRGKKPGITIYLDGPFYPDASLPAKEQKSRLRDEIYNCMARRSRESTYQYIIYKKEKN